MGQGRHQCWPSRRQLEPIEKAAQRSPSVATCSPERKPLRSKANLTSFFPKSGRSAVRCSIDTETDLSGWPNAGTDRPQRRPGRGVMTAGTTTSWPIPAKAGGVCPSCNTRRMVETAAHLTDHVLARDFPTHAFHYQHTSIATVPLHSRGRQPHLVYEATSGFTFITA